VRTRTLLFRSLIHYWRTNAAVVVGVATAVAVLAGALLVGASVRASLRDLVNARLGRADVVVRSSHFFREALADDVARLLRGARAGAESSQQVCPLIALEGFVVDDASGRRAGRVNVYGVDERFWRFHRLDPRRAPRGRDVLMSAPLARELATGAGGSILVGLEQPSAIPGGTLFGRKDEQRKTARFWVRETLNGPPGEFTLARDQGVVRAIFVPLERLQHDLERTARVNLLLFSDFRAGLPIGGIRTALTLDDVGLRLRPVEGGNAIAVESMSGLLDDHVITSVEAIATQHSLRRMAVFTYLANTIRVGDREVPYSVVTAMDQNSLWSPASAAASMAHHPIVLNEWTARDLKARPGDTVTLDYYLWHEEGRLTTAQAQFTLAAIVPMTGLAADRELVPDYPGITGAESVSDWDPPFPLDLSRIRPQDEEYWNEFRATPKAFVPFETGQKLWQLRYGRMTSMRLYPATASGAAVVAARFETDLRNQLVRNPTALGVRAEDVRAAGMAAARGATDFGEYFLYFSFFVVVSALMLAGLFFKLGVEQRVREIGVLSASGFAAGDVNRLFFAEAIAIAVAGAVAGVLAALGYAGLVLLGLRTWWVGAVGTDRLALHIVPGPLIVGAAGGILASLATLWWTLRRLRRVSTRRLLAGEIADATDGAREGAGRYSRSAAAAWVAALAAIALPLVVWLGAIPAAPGFFGAGAAAMIAAAAFSLARLQSPAGRVLQAGRLALSRLGMRNAAHRPARTVLGMALIAFASFVIISVDAFRREHHAGTDDRRSGTGGFAFVAESAVPLYHDPRTKEGREALNLSTLPNDVRIARFRLRPGDDASCLNLYVPQRPRIIAPEPAFVREARFTFQTPADENPWLLLDASLPGDAVPTIADQTTIQYVLHKQVGDEIVIDEDTSRPIRLRLVAALADSVLQGELIVSERQFIRLFPQHDGYRFFLVEAASQDTIAVLEDALSDFGFDAVSAPERLASFHRVENTYLATFQSLGALGLVLGTVGLASVVLRNVLERRRELALLRASGFTTRALGTTILAEHALIVGAGLATGTVAALIATAPIIAARGGDWPWRAIVILAIAVPAAGLGSSLVATRAALKEKLVDVLKTEA
jgi:putative ABC transport system permease protein